MAFENISKGEFESKDGFITTENNIIALVYNLKDKKENAEFIAFCFNLQQRYDISKLEEAVELFVEMIDSDLINTYYTEKIEQLLKQIKK